MTQETNGPVVPVTEHDRLNGWKEIASFLGKSVRTVQRWEAEYGLPVRRVGREGGEIVWASRAEVGQWNAREAQKLQRPEPRPVGRRHWIVALVGIVLAVCAFAWVAAWDPSSRHATTAQVTGNTLSVYDSRMRYLFSKTFPFKLSHLNYSEPQYRAGEQPVVILDLDRDGTNEVVVMVEAEDRVEGQGLYVYNEDGTERFHRTLQAQVHFGDRSYDGPWLPFKMFVLSDASGFPSIWFAYIHGEHFPSFLQHVDASGKLLSEYWSNGYVEFVTVQTWKGRPTVFVGATNYETGGASLAVFDGNEVWGTAPAVASVERCSDCSVGAPSAFLRFPRRDMAAKTGRSTTVGQVWVESGRFVHVLAVERFEAAAEAGVSYVLDDNLHPTTIEVSAELPVQHRRLEPILRHAFGQSDANDLQPVSIWQAGKFVDLPHATVILPNR
jgi:hypothetical protein